LSNVIEIKPMTRVEGYGSVRLYLSGKRVERVELALFDSPRLFEALVSGKPYAELPEIICRICSLCSTVHRVTALAAIEQAFGVKISEQTRLFRELALCGGHIQSHALHLFCLVLPDLLDVGGFPGLAQKAPELLLRGMRIKSAGNLIQETVGGRLIHPVTLIPGGMGKPVSRDGLRQLKEALTAVLDEAVASCDLFTIAPNSSGRQPIYMAVEGGRISPAGSGQIQLSGAPLLSTAEYRHWLREEVVSHSFAKSSTVNGKVVTVGALARLNSNAVLAPKAAQQYSANKEQLAGAGITANSLAQSVELVHAVEHAIGLIGILVGMELVREEPALINPHKSEGTAAIEAPRGTLIHSYSFDEQGHCIAADVVTPTAINQAAMEFDLFTLARSMEAADEADLRQELEKRVRAYDPCISCAVHLVRLQGSSA